MDYDFSSLSHSDFEDLARDLIGREFGVRFEAFPEGPDDGMDGRHAAADGNIILQAKHYIGSGASKLNSKMKSERTSIDALQPTRYVLATSAPLTPKNKATLVATIGPALQSTGDIFGPGDLNALLRKYPDIETAHQKLWGQNTAVLKTIVTAAVADALPKPAPIPPALANLLPVPGDADSSAEPPARDTLFLLKSSPADDEFALWLAPKLEAEGYRVFADILTLQPGDRWRREINRAIEHRAAKVLLVCRNATADDQAIQDDLDIALDVAKAIGDTRFIIQLKLEQGRKMKGLGDAIAVDFVRGWGEGLSTLSEALKRQKAPRRTEGAVIDPNWELFRRRGAIPLKNEPERLTSNWLRVVEAPDAIHFYEATGVIDADRLKRAAATHAYPIAVQGRGFLSFADQDEIDDGFASVGRFKLKRSIPLKTFVENGDDKLRLEKQPAQNIINVMLKRAWYEFCKERGLLEYQYSGGVGFHASPDLAATGQRIPWGKQGARRSSMLRNVAKGHIWQFGVTALPAFWPFWHFKLKSRVLFAGDNGTPAGLEIEDAKKLHRLRRTICKGWRNKQWYGRMLAFLELISGESAYIRLRLSATADAVLEAAPILFSSPVSTDLPDALDADEEETDLSTLGRPEADEEEVAA
ncbi:toll/interleukin-1 receptor domain-containing protein [Sphingopyxis terrae]|uniref:toll/interleukin-1 receptor domain-containing protein n=1 Tax=Sphingopyxis terrae TaxID=33052 RepID=UPI0007893E08|nr:toll/interleukin-1 receptor domain-containing protein [Sphingopyxis terrae]